MNKLLWNGFASCAVLLCLGSGMAFAACTTKQVGATTFYSCGTPVAEGQFKTHGASLSIQDKTNGASQKTNAVPTGNAQNDTVPKFKATNP